MSTDISKIGKDVIKKRGIIETKIIGGALSSCFARTKVLGCNQPTLAPNAMGCIEIIIRTRGSVMMTETNSW
jgi:hypothetical protein